MTAQARADAAAAWNTEAVGSRVLVVDDDADMRRTLARLLRVEGLEVLEEADGAAALATARTRQPDLVLMDVVMPRMSGMDVCRLLKEDPVTRLIPVLLLTGHGHAESRLQGLELGADDFLAKPPERAELVARVKSLLRMKRHTDQLVRAEAVVMSLGRSIEAKDGRTEGHCERLSQYGALLGSRLGLPEQMCDALAQAGFLHDIGKVAVPDSILLKPGPLTAAEWEVMKRHPLIGEHICEPIHSFADVLPIIRHHHEKRDGSGYPDGLAGDRIPITARVLQVVDVYDALVSDRPYKAALPPEAALSVMASEVARGWWDPECFAAFAAMAREDPAAFSTTTAPPPVRGPGRKGTS